MASFFVESLLYCGAGRFFRADSEYTIAICKSPALAAGRWEKELEAVMSNSLQAILELSRDPVLALEDGTILLMNAAARQAFPGCRVGGTAQALFPDTITFAQAEEFVSGVVIGGVRYAVSAVRSDGLLFLSLAAEEEDEAARGFLSEGMLSGMLSSLFNVGLASERLRAALPADDADAARYLAMLDHSYYTLLRRVSNLNTLCALMDGSMQLTYCRVDLVALCGDIVSSTALLTRDACARLLFETELEALTACVGASKVEHLILNLLSNSLKHTPKDGLIRLRLSRSGSNALISVSDNGSGIPPKQLKYVFHSFRDRRALETLCLEPGGGIGLALCRVIAEKHGGTLILESREGAGTDVRVLLPLAPPETVELMSSSADYTNGGMSVLLAELSELLDAAAYEKRE